MTTRRWRLTQYAEATLIDVARWTLRTFGPRQAEAYEADLVERCEALAANAAPSRQCRDVFDPALDAALRVSRRGGHFIVFVERDDMMIVVDFLHVRSDIPSRLGAAPLADED